MLSLSVPNSLDLPSIHVSTHKKCYTGLKWPNFGLLFKVSQGKHLMSRTTLTVLPLTPEDEKHFKAYLDAGYKIRREVRNGRERLVIVRPNHRNRIVSTVSNSE